MYSDPLGSKMVKEKLWTLEWISVGKKVGEWSLAPPASRAGTGADSVLQAQLVSWEEAV